MIRPNSRSVRPALEQLEVRVVPQATRTWVSGVGDDANPCSRTAPCKTFAGAISKTAVGGEIDVLDPGGFGAVTITKSITIDGGGFQAGVLVSGTNGIVISPGSANIVVVLRGLNINGLGSGLQGITVTNDADPNTSLAALFVENCNIQQFSGNGIDFKPDANSKLFVTNTTVQSNNQVAGPTTKAGIYIHPSGGNTQATITGSHLYNNLNGLEADGNVQVMVGDTDGGGNAQSDFLALLGATINGLSTPESQLTPPVPPGQSSPNSTVSMTVGGNKRVLEVRISGPTGAATGRVLFLDGKNLLGLGVLSNGQASLRLGRSGRTRRVHVIYLGDARYAYQDFGFIKVGKGGK